MRRWPLIVTALVAVLGGAPRARADEVEDFDRARQAYEAQNYAQAVSLFEAMVGGEVPRIRNPVLILESRKYLGAAYLFVDRRDDAKAQFGWLLSEDPSYELDPFAFPDAVQQAFVEVKEELAEQAAAAERERLAAEERLREQSLEELLAQQERIARLEALAREEVVLHSNSRWIATVPFGAGQLQNGHVAAGRFFAIGEGFAFAGTIVTKLVFDWAERRGRNPEASAADRASFRRVGRTMRGLNLGLWALGGALLVIGIIDAHIRFVPARREVRERELPEDIGEPGPDLSLAVGVGTLDLRLTF